MTNSRQKIHDKVKKDLFLISGGRCEKCSRPVIHIEGDHSNICDIAHIYGLKEGSARYEAGKEMSYLNSFDNLMILCKNCHKMIDNNPSKYTVKKLEAMKRKFEKEAINEISSLENKTNIGGHIDYKNGQKLLNFFNKDSVTKIKNPQELSKLLKSGDEDANTINFVLKLIKRLSNLNIDSRQALLKIMNAQAKGDTDYIYSSTYWDSCYGKNIRDVLDPLDMNNYIDTSGFSEETYDNRINLTINEELSFLIAFLQEYTIPFEELIITRNYSVIDG